MACFNGCVVSTLSDPESSEGSTNADFSAGHNSGRASETERGSRARAASRACSTDSPARQMTKTSRAPVRRASWRTAARSDGWPYVASSTTDPYSALKTRAREALFQRLGPRLTDPDVSEDQLLSLAAVELRGLLDAEQLPLTQQEKRRWHRSNRL